MNVNFLVLNSINVYHFDLIIDWFVSCIMLEFHATEIIVMNDLPMRKWMRGRWWIFPFTPWIYIFVLMYIIGTVRSQKLI